MERLISPALATQLPKHVWRHLERRAYTNFTHLGPNRHCQIPPVSTLFGGQTALKKADR